MSLAIQIIGSLSILAAFMLSQWNIIKPKSLIYLWSTWWVLLFSPSTRP
jgi:hypothetical protein